METAPRNCRFLSLVVVELALNYTHEIIIFEFFGGLQLQLLGVNRIHLHYSYSFLALFAQSSYRK